MNFIWFYSIFVVILFYITTIIIIYGSNSCRMNPSLQAIILHCCIPKVFFFNVSPARRKQSPECTIFFFYKNYYLKYIIIIFLIVILCQFLIFCGWFALLLIISPFFCLIRPMQKEQKHIAVKRRGLGSWGVGGVRA